MWSATDEESKKDGDGLPSTSSSCAARLSFDAKRDADGVVLHSREHPGLFVGWLRNEAPPPRCFAACRTP